MRKANVRLVCTTEGPLDSLEHHKIIKRGHFGIKVHTAFRPDKAMAVEDITAMNVFIDKLEEICNMEITNFYILKQSGNATLISMKTDVGFPTTAWIPLMPRITLKKKSKKSFP
jgi:glucuronate isomerase